MVLNDVIFMNWVRSNEMVRKGEFRERDGEWGKK